MTPPPDPLEDGAGVEGSEALRRRYLRRRVTAGLAALLVVIWIVSIVVPGGSGKPRAATQPATPADAATRAAAARRAAALAAERVRDTKAIQTALTYTAYVTAGSADKREMALTFDDGPGPFTAQVVATLRRLHVPATFFVVGRNVKDFGASLPAVVDAGFPIGDHTQDHAAMSALSRPDQVNQLLDQARAIHLYGAPFPRLFRPPYGQFNATTLAITKKLKMLTILWSIDPGDFRQPGVDKIVQNVMTNAKPGAIVLLHDAGGPREQTIAAIPRIVAGLRHRGYSLVTIPRLLADDPPLESQEIPPTGLSGG